MERERAQELLRDVGMSGYEAKAYLALLAAGEPLNGYEVAKASGVPRSTVYETLGKLVARGAAFETRHPANGTAYLALPAETLLARLRRDTAATIEGLTDVLPRIRGRSDTRVVQHLHGRTALLERAVDVADAATRSLFVSMWPAELEEVRAALAAATARRVEVTVLAFGEVDAGDPPIGEVVAHRYSSPEVVLERMGSRVFTLVADHRAVLVGGVDGSEVWGLWSDDPAVAMVAAEYVRHDIALQLIGERLRASGLEDFWRNDPALERLRAASWLHDHTARRSGPEAPAR